MKGFATSVCLLAAVFPYGVAFIGTGNHQVDLRIGNSLLFAHVGGEKAIAGRKTSAARDKPREQKTGPGSDKGAGPKAKSTARRGNVSRAKSKAARNKSNVSPEFSELVETLLVSLSRTTNKKVVRETISRLQSSEFKSFDVTLDPAGLAICLAACRAFGDWRRSQALINHHRLAGKTPDSTCVDIALGACGRGGGDATEGLAMLRALSLEEPSAVAPVGVLGWAGLFECCARTGDASAAAQTLAYLVKHVKTQAFMAPGPDAMSEATAEGEPDAEKLCSRFLSSEPLVLGAATAAFQSTELPAVLALAHEIAVSHVAQDLAIWKQTVRCLGSVQRRRSFESLASSPNDDEGDDDDDEEEEAEVMTLDLHGAHAGVAGAAIRSIFRDARRAQRSSSEDGYAAIAGGGGGAGVALAVVTGRGLHSPTTAGSAEGPSAKVRDAALAALVAEGAEPLSGVDAEGPWTPWRNPGVLFVPAEKMAAALQPGEIQKKFGF